MKRKFKKFLGLFCSCMVLSSTILGNVAMAGSAKSVISENFYPENFYPGEMGETQKFQSTDDNPVPSVRKSYNRGDLIYTTTHRNELGTVAYTDSAYFISKSFISQRFIKYLTSSWSKASSYTWSKSNSVSISGSGSATLTFAKKVAAALGLSVSRTTTYSVAVNLPADASRYSKLGFYSDCTKMVYNYKHYKDSTLLTDSTDTYYTPEKDTYLSVVYKQ